MNVGLGYLFNSSRYDFSQPGVVIPTLITDVLFAADTGIDAAKELTEKARLEKIKADATYVKEQYIAQEGKKAEEAFKKAEATKEQRITESDVKKSREQMTAELQEEINKLLPPEPPTRVEVPKPEQQKTPLYWKKQTSFQARQTSERGASDKNRSPKAEQREGDRYVFRPAEPAKRVGQEVAPELNPLKQIAQRTNSPDEFVAEVRRISNVKANYPREMKKLELL